MERIYEPGAAMNRLCLSAFLTGFLIAAMACGDDEPTGSVPGVPVAVEAVVQPPAAAPIGAEINLRVRVRDAFDNGVTDVTVSFEITEGNGTLGAAGPAPIVAGPAIQARPSLEPIEVQTDAQGQAAVTWTLGLNIGDQSVRARAVGSDGSTISQVIFTVTALPAE